jgi:Peptidase family M28
MKQKILAIIICMLMIVTVFPAVGFSIQTEEIKNLNFSQPFYIAPSPGYAQIPPPATFRDTSVVHDHPEKTATTMDDIVISMLEQVDASIYLRYLENLTGFGPRVTGTSACKAAAEYIYSQFDSMGLSVCYYQWRDIYNVEATINGTDESSDEIYIICAHYDTVSSTVGADDDASGTVAVLVAALILSQSQYTFNHTIKFVAFAGEEQGLLGSQGYAAIAADEGWNIVGVLNADMISYAVTTTDGNYIIVFQNEASEWLYNFSLDISTTYNDYIRLIPLKGGFSGGSDHFYFWQEGYDALFYFESTTTPYYHTSGDTIAHINATYAAKTIRLMLATLAGLSEARFLRNPPAKPVLSGPSSGVIDQPYTLSVVTTEPDKEDVYYFIEWGDEQADEWLGPYQSGVITEITHQWNNKGTYTIRAKAKDVSSLESDWAYLTVTMPHSYNKPMQYIELFLHRFPNAFPLLRNLLSY